MDDADDVNEVFEDTNNINDVQTPKRKPRGQKRRGQHNGDEDGTLKQPVETLTIPQFVEKYLPLNIIVKFAGVGHYGHIVSVKEDPKRRQVFVAFVFLFVLAFSLSNILCLSVCGQYTTIDHSVK